MPSEAQPLASVTICTRNRAPSLARTLRSITVAAAQVAEPWELVVVDNGSTDNTQDIIASFADSLPIRSVLQPVAGISNARNAGVAAARGDLIIWTDDDVLVDPDWLAAHLRAFQAFPECDVFGGRIVPRLEDPVTPWFAESQAHLGFLLAHRDQPEWVEITPERLPFGANYAVRTHIQRQFPYDTELGVAPGRRLGGEETTMVTQALASGAAGRWVWDSTVYHLIQPARQTHAYIFQYYRSLGYGHPKVSLDTDIASRVGAYAVAAIRLIRKGTVACLRRALGNPLWVASYTEFARTVGAFDRLRGRSPS